MLELVIAILGSSEAITCGLITTLSLMIVYLSALPKYTKRLDMTCIFKTKISFCVTKYWFDFNPSNIAVLCNL